MIRTFSIIHKSICNNFILVLWNFYVVSKNMFYVRVNLDYPKYNGGTYFDFNLVEWIGKFKFMKILCQFLNLPGSDSKLYN